MGCYPTGKVYAAFNDGLTKNMTSEIIGWANPIVLVNGYYMFSLTRGMTIESCVKVCFEKSFLFAGIGRFVLTLYEKID